MPQYDRQWFDPPAPLARILLRDPKAGTAWPDVPMLIDTGADVTLVPEAVIDRLGAGIDPEKVYELVGYGGAVSHAPVVRLELVFCRRTFRGQFLLTDQEWGILGRNVLNAVPLLLDGPRLLWDGHRTG